MRILREKAQDNSTGKFGFVEFDRDVLSVYDKEKDKEYLYLEWHKAEVYPERQVAVLSPIADYSYDPKKSYASNDFARKDVREVYEDVLAFESKIQKWTDGDAKRLIEQIARDYDFIGWDDIDQSWFEDLDEPSAPTVEDEWCERLFGHEKVLEMCNKCTYWEDREEFWSEMDSVRQWMEKG